MIQRAQRTGKIIINGDIDLSMLILENPFDTMVMSQVDFTLSGTPVVQEASMAVTSLNIIQGHPNHRITYGLIKRIVEIASVPLAQYPIEICGEILTFRFRNEDPPAVTAQPLVPTHSPDDSDIWINPIIKIMTI